MSRQAWNVKVDGVDHRITLDNDGETGRISIRLDGKMAARPLTPTDEEREFKVGSEVYVLRRMPDGSFDLDVVAPDFAAYPGPAVSQRTASGAAKPQKSSNGKLVLAVVLLLVAGGIWWIWQSMAYSRISWKSWTSPDQTVSIDFPGVPKVESETVKAGEDSVEFKSYSSEYRDRTYGLVQYDIDAALEPHEAPKVLEEELRWYWDGYPVTGLAEVSINRHDAIRYQVNYPAEDGDPPVTIRGLITVHQRKIYVLMVESPVGDKPSSDLVHFLSSMRLPEGNAYLYRDTRPDAASRRGQASALKGAIDDTGSLVSFYKPAVVIVALILGILMFRSRMSS